MAWNKNKNQDYPFRGRPALAVILGFIANFFSGAFLNTFGAIISPLRETFSVSGTSIVAAPMIYLALMSISSPFIGLALDRLSIRRVMLAASGVIAVGFMLLSTVSTLWEFLLVAGLLLALPAQAAGTAAGMKIAATALPGRRGLALGIAGLGISISSMSFPAIAVALLDASNWRITYLVLGGAVVLCLWPMILLLVPHRPSEGNRISVREVFSAMGEFVRAPGFWHISFIIGSQMATMSIMAINLIEFGTSKGFARSEAAYLLAILGSMSAAGKVLWGMAMDKFPGRAVPWTALALQGLALLALLTAHDYRLAAASCALVGLAIGAAIPMQSMLVGRVLGWNNFAAAYGATSLAMQPLILGALYLTALSRDTTGGYTHAFLGLLALVGLAALVNSRMRVTRES